MTPAQWNEYQRQAEVIEKAAEQKKEVILRTKKNAKTAMQLLFDELNNYPEIKEITKNFYWDYFFGMEKIQIKNARADGLEYAFGKSEFNTHSQYFNETYIDNNKTSEL
jgi:hypothetical protein